MKISSSCEFLFKETGAKRWLNRPRLPKFNAILPRAYNEKKGFNPSAFVYSGDPDFLKLTEFLAEKLTKEFPASANAEGWAGENAVPGTFYNVLNTSGYGMNPMSAPLLDNSSFIASLGLRDTIKTVDRPFFNEIVRLFFGHVAPENLHIRKQASSGFPYFTNDIQYRKLATLKCLHNIDDWLNCMTGDDADLERGLDEYHSVLAYSVNERQQPNAILLDKDGKYFSKPRDAASPADARSGHFDGGQQADMSVKDKNGVVIPNHFAMRRRVVFGMSGVVNYVMTAFQGCVRAVYLERFAFTYKTRDAADKERKINNYTYLVGSDVKAMDTTIPKWFFELLLEELHKYWDPRLVELLKRMLYATYVLPPPAILTPDDYDPVFGGSPLKSKKDETHVGLPSGVFINPDLGKLWMTFVYLVLYKDSGAILTASEIEPLLRGENKQHALLDSSDDATMLTNSPSVAAKLRVASSPYAILEPEVPVLYLGDVFALVNGEKRAFPNPVTYIVNALAREDSIDRIDPVAHAEGVLARYQVYSKTPCFRDLNAILEEGTKKYAKINPYLLARSMAKRQRWSDTDALLKANHHYLHYRIDAKDVSPEVLDEIVATIPHADFYDKIKHLFLTSKD